MLATYESPPKREAVMNDPVFWQLGAGVLQESVLVTAVLVGGFYLFRAMIRGLETLDRAGKRRTTLVVEPKQAPVVEPHLVAQ
jgi:hypothetical protein